MPYDAIILGLWLILVVYWIASAQGNKPTAYRFNPVWRILALLVIVGLFLAIRARPDFFHRRLYLPTETLRWTGIFVCAAGVGFAIWARHTLGTNWSGAPTIKEGHELVETGPYRYVRHPIYTGILFGIAGSGIGSGQIKHLFVLAIVAALLWIKLKVEESLMRRQFPQSYPDYMQRTKALIPFVL
jgi:protein-S-isoprenylcysteine O-methyltransferase Ste14